MKKLHLQTVKSDRLYLKVAEQLRKLVSDGKIQPGERFPPERELAETFGVSRPTIREAMIALELSGIIDIRTGSGIYVTEKRANIGAALRDAGVGPFEILETRHILESEACALAAERITDAQIAELKQALKDMEEEAQRPDASEKADWKFHLIIAQACQNSAIYSVVNSLWELRNQSPLSTAFLERVRKEGITPSLGDHHRILEALEARDPDKARNAMRTHIENATANAAIFFDK